MYIGPNNHPPKPSFPFHPNKDNVIQSFARFGRNTSALVHDGLPSHIVRKNRPPISILKYQYDINSIYSEILALGPELWNGKRAVHEPGSASEKALEIDVMVHIGMHPDYEMYFVERRARRERYEHAGGDGRLLAKNALKGQPEKLFVGFDVDELARRMVGMLGVGFRLSPWNF